MNNKLVTIKNVRGYIGENEVAYLNLEDVARGLGFEKREVKNGKEYRRLNKQIVKNWLIDFGIINSENGLPEFIPENIFYKLCMKANNEIARKFQDLVCDEILPSIRKNGIYATEMTIENMISNPDFAISLLTKLKEEQENRKKLQLQVEQQKPKVEYYENVLQSSKLLTTSQIGKDLGMSARKLNEILNDLGIIYKQSNTWMFFSEHQDKVPEYADYVIGENYQQLKWTEKGRQWILELLKENEII